ncbi:MAG TPA: AgmX/PglI C-terminal domain-containing protein [Polyangiaceae bacterium LLY-WYZ-15_(1-7)]|nr:hypothetical protein [Sandaracinus sp.]MBJ73136.1 hypothetical protein [Sandaracinus sp.]HJL05146.1 AgmX/PglI C-terminal domain-containing protein [Polyangiaceae bacterium LLY-WYZ-15_(1-7)]HJL12997.1 AgmX/PglI C-terminal domain-containing protein [Polyangiaceae bacterium LLY-WYZ-15_(1-7)]
MFCQSCGAKNSDDAKFCNQCGTSIARPGDAGGPITTRQGAAGGASSAPPAAAAPAPGPAAPAPAAAGPHPQNDPSSTVVGVGDAAPAVPPPGQRPNAYAADAGYGGASMMSVSLASIGVRSSKKVWGVIALIAVALVAAGALGMWLFRGDPEVVAEAGHAEPDDPFVIGTPLPEGEEPPEVDIVSGGEAEVGGGESGEAGGGGASAMAGATAMRGTSSSMRSTGGSRPSSSGSGTSGGGSAGSGSSAGSGTSGSGSSSAGSGSAGSGSSAGGGTSAMESGSSGGSGGGTSAMESGASGSGTSGNGTSGSGSSGGSTSMESGSSGGGGSVPTEEVPEERDLELELYGSRVRFVIRRYYAARAQSCFDRATRNQPSLSGTVVIGMTIGADGKVSRTRVARNTTGDDDLGRCLSNNVSTWELPPPPGGSLDMQMPFSR